MCTAITFKGTDSYFGRTLDLEYSYNETVTVTPRFFPFHFRNENRIDYHYAIIGMAAFVKGYPLYYDATNEKGLSMAGLNFPENARYFKKSENKINITPFEFIPYILSKCDSVKSAKELLKEINLTDAPFSSDLPNSPLHWIIADKTEAVTVESTEEGLNVYENPVGVLTNNPPFPYHMTHLTTFMHLSPYPQENKICKELNLKAFSRGTGAMGLPGDCSSQSRFVRAAFNKLNAATFDTEKENVEQFFHILSSVEQIDGTVKTSDNKNVRTVYTSCCNTDKGIYYYTTYHNRSITGVDMHRENLDSTVPVSYPLRKSEIFIENRA